MCDGPTLPPSLKESVRKAVDLLHKGNIVFGDLRPQNILHLTGTDRVWLVDFDWAGKAIEATYPLLMSNSVQWAAGMGAGAGMQLQHDEDMFCKLYTGNT